MRRRMIAVALTAFALPLAACGSDSGSGSSPSSTPTNGTASGSASDKKVMLYSGRNEKLVKPVIDAFTKETGVQVDVRYGETAAMAAQLVEEGDKTPAEVFLAQDAGALAVVSKAGLLNTLPSQPTAKVAATYRSPNNDWVGVTGRARVLAYDSQTVKESSLPASVLDLAKPEWKGKVGVAPTNASFQSFVTALRVEHGDAKALQFLKDLKANDPQIREKNGQIVSDVNDGKIQVGLVNHYYLYELAKEKGVAPTALRAKNHWYTNGDVGGLVNVSGVALTKKNSDADGQALIDYLLSPAAQKQFVDQASEYPTVQGVAAPAGVPPLASLQSSVSLQNLDGLEKSIDLIKQAGLL